MVVLSSMWERIQSDLFPFLEEELGPLTKKLRGITFLPGRGECPALARLAVEGRYLLVLINPTARCAC